MVLQFSLSTLPEVGGWSNNIDSKLFVNEYGCGPLVLFLNKVKFVFVKLLA